MYILKTISKLKKKTLRYYAKNISSLWGKKNADVA